MGAAACSSCSCGVARAEALYRRATPCTIRGNRHSQTVPIMSSTSISRKPVKKTLARPLGADIVMRDPKQFWLIEVKPHHASQQSLRKAFHQLVDRVRTSPGAVLYDAVESGVPTYMVDVIAGVMARASMGQPRPAMTPRVGPSSVRSTSCELRLGVMRAPGQPVG